MAATPEDNAWVDSVFDTSDTFAEDDPILPGVERAVKRAKLYRKQTAYRKPFVVTPLTATPTNEDLLQYEREIEGGSAEAAQVRWVRAELGFNPAGNQPLSCSSDAVQRLLHTGATWKLHS